MYYIPEIPIKYYDPNTPSICAIEKGDWIDVKAVNIRINDVAVPWVDGKIKYKAGDVLKVFLGFAMELPAGFEAHVAPRGSTFKVYGWIQTNSVGIVDNSFCGDDDEWFVPFLAMRDGEVEIYERVAQTRLFEKCPPLKFRAVRRLTGMNRGSMGSTGKL